MLPKEMGCVGDELLATTARLAEGRRWDRLHEVLLAKLRAADRIDWSRVIVDSSSIRAVRSGQKQDPTPPIARDPVQSITS